VGAGWATEQGYLGAAVETADQHYGVTVEPDVFIRMQRQRVSLAGELRALPGPFSQLTAQASQTRYEHQEVEGSGELGTTFKSRGSELRLQARHAGIGGLDAVRGVHGVMGLQAETMTFSALGAEAFVPGTRTRSGAVFALEEWSGGAAVLSAGARVESVRVASNGDDPTAAEVKFGAPGQRRFTPTSLSLGARAAPADGWSVSGTLSQTERAPAYYELYANGVHVATAAYERGNPQLPAERSRHAEAGLGWSEGPHMLKASLFSTRFSRFISLDATGTDITIPGVAGAAGTVVPEYAFSSVRARMDGVEIEGHTRLLTQPFALDLSAGLDTARGSNLDSGEPLPRLAPLRARAALEAAFPGWHAGLGVRHAARQARVPATDSATPGHTLLDLWAGGPIGLGEASSWFARLNNATNQLAYSAATITTMRGLAPLPGRALTLGLRGQF
jgi:iron complex outermembrane receptor protein